MRCRHCGQELKITFIDLGSTPPSNAFLTEKDLHLPEKCYPLRVLVCTGCWLVQTEDFTGPEQLFNSYYPYFSSFSSSWLAHAERYVQEMIERFDLGADSHVVEVASNDGYLLQYVKALNIPCTGVEPTAMAAMAAREKGISVIEDFFGVDLAKTMTDQGKQADLIVANNVLAHVPDINDFVAAITCLLKPRGIATFEFPHLLKLVSQNQFDTIYHEHFSYLSLTAVNSIFETNGLSVFDVQELPTHGGSLRVFAQRSENFNYSTTSVFEKILDQEVKTGIISIEYYSNFQKRAETVKNDLLTFLIELKKAGSKVVAYGAAAKGNTLLNFAGIRPDLLSYVIDRNPVKQGKYMPGSRIPIFDEETFKNKKADFVIILPWNLKTEIMDQLSYIRSWGGRFVTAIPYLEVV